MAFALFTLSIISVADEKPQDTEHPTLPNWYQVEVVLFDQKNILGDEQAPKEVNLDFPGPLIELHNSYQNTGIMRRPLFDSLSKSSLIDLNQASLSDRIYTYLGIPHFRYITENQSDINLVPEASIPYQADSEPESRTIPIEQQSELGFSKEDAVEIKTSNMQIPSDFKPVFEAPFRTLNKNDRDLNDTVSALNRRNYSVHFHQAWRFEITSKQQSQWILLKVGETHAQRYVIEGALRFYKSRFLHFETDFWKYIFSDNSQAEMVLPEIPQKPLNSEEQVLISAMQFSNSYLTLSPNPPVANSLIQNALNGYNLQSIIPLFSIAQDNSENDSFPIQEIWPIKQSKRIQEEEVYYIDHPQIGALVSIKPYKPVPINVPPIQSNAAEEQLLDASK
jgi:hypothetical protein